MVFGKLRLRKSPAQNGQRQTREPISIGAAVADISPPGAAVEGILEGAPVGPGGKAGRHGEVAELAWQESRVELTVKEQGFAGKGPDPSLMGDRLQRLLDACRCEPRTLSSPADKASTPGPRRRR